MRFIAEGNAYRCAEGWCERVTEWDSYAVGAVVVIVAIVATLIIKSRRR
jgi:hypothetical protein